MVQIVAVGYALDKLVVTYIENRGKSLTEVINLKHTEIIITIIVLVIGFGAGNFAEGKIDDWFLTRYKHLLSRIVADASSRLWLAYNTFRELLAQAQSNIIDVERRLQTVNDPVATLKKGV